MVLRIGLFLVGMGIACANAAERGGAKQPAPERRPKSEKRAESPRAESPRAEPPSAPVGAEPTQGEEFSWCPDSQYEKTRNAEGQWVPVTDKKSKPRQVENGSRGK